MPKDLDRQLRKCVEAHVGSYSLRSNNFLNSAYYEEEIFNSFYDGALCHGTYVYRAYRHVRRRRGEI